MITAATMTEVETPLNPQILVFSEVLVYFGFWYLIHLRGVR